MAHRIPVRLGVLLLCATIVALSIGVAATSVRAAKATLTVYTAVEADDLKKYAARFNEDHPDIEIKWVLKMDQSHSATYTTLHINTH